MNYDTPSTDYGFDIATVEGCDDAIAYCRELIEEVPRMYPHQTPTDIDARHDQYVKLENDIATLEYRRGLLQEEDPA